MYQVGLMETDPHIEFFWAALETFTQEELCKFIKFACNQERIPFTCPCKDGGPDTGHVPPYPMKIAPPDGAAGTGQGNGENIDSRLCICVCFVTDILSLLSPCPLWAVGTGRSDSDYRPGS